MYDVILAYEIGSDAFKYRFYATVIEVIVLYLVVKGVLEFIEKRKKGQKEARHGIEPSG